MAGYRNEDEGQTLLDRLLWQPDAVDDAGRRGNPMIDSIARDLEMLMNSRRPEGDFPETYPEVATSILNFGMPALGGYGDIATGAEQNRLCRSIEDAVHTFEPRLKRAQVRVAASEPGQKSVVRFRMEATVAEISMREIFELRLKPETGEMTVAAGGGS